MSNKDQDKKIVELLYQKDTRTLISFYKENAPAVRKFVYRQIHDYHLAEEITQDAFLDFLEAIRNFNYQSSLKTFLFSIARNKVVDQLRKKKIKKILFSSLPHYLVEGIKIFLIDDELDRKETRAKIERVLKKLPNDYQLVLRLKYVEGEKVQQIADKLTLKFKATESLIFRARKAFIKLFNSHSE